MEFLAAILVLSIICFSYNKVDLIKQSLVINSKFIDEVKIKKLCLIARNDLEYFSKRKNE